MFNKKNNEINRLKKELDEYNVKYHKVLISNFENFKNLIDSIKKETNYELNFDWELIDEEMKFKNIKIKEKNNL